uniref:Uncharacterized protein n=1 Tax=uncultured Thiotrichaceae bacterium TaxID=298394 RepID=A0A6S6SU63_9GAMM|nr:MAG: Unknown protein [uncultured Thiotrichaceae bacterium]
MADTAVLRRMLQPNIIIPLQDHYNDKKKLLLQEPQADDSCIEIHNVPADSIVIDLDRAFSNQGLFCGSQGECKRADYLLISEQTEKILFIELKQSSSGKSGIIKQLQGSLCAFEYCQIIAREFFHEAEFLQSYQQRFIAFTHTTSRSRKTEVEREVVRHGTPQQPLMIRYTRTFQFNQMAA